MAGESRVSNIGVDEWNKVLFELADTVSTSYPDMLAADQRATPRHTNYIATARG